ncbi:MAG TPA: imidazole glycerol phosphate synthase subunit HisH [Holophagaceae bacterium]|nr:imidazole glycerol phosphate synthase subunit HisH [Holophagaceae bacterium]
MITVIDHGAGNLASLEGALEAFGLPFRRAARPEAAEGLLLLPGDGHFAAAREALVDTGWWEALPELVDQGHPLLGICVGLQLLAQESEEAPGLPGLGLLPGHVRRLGPDVKVPHMGWSRAKQVDAHPAFAGAGDEAWLYFVHAYALDVTEATVFYADHGRVFSAVAGQGRVLGFQPHPEKSGAPGRDLLRRALRWLLEKAEA